MLNGLNRRQSKTETNKISVYIQVLGYRERKYTKTDVDTDVITSPFHTEIFQFHHNKVPSQHCLCLFALKNVTPLLSVISVSNLSVVRFLHVQ